MKFIRKMSKRSKSKKHVSRNRSRKLRNRSRKHRNSRHRYNLKGGDTYDLVCPYCLDTLGSPPGDPIEISCPFQHKYHRACATTLCEGGFTNCLLCQQPFSCAEVNSTNEIMDVVNPEISGDQ